jgi:acyl-coenzyme A thioesterase PaaI-like protein
VDPADFARNSTARLDAAAAVRRLAHALVAHGASDEALTALAQLAGAAAARLEHGPARTEPTDGLARWTQVRPDRAELSCFADCLISGPANPLSTAPTAHRDGDEAVLTVTLQPGFGGLPGRAHGGIIASLFDEVMGFALSMDGQPAYTAWLRVDYRTPLAVGVPLEFRARVTARDGRRFHVAAQVRSAGELGPAAEALYLAPRP